MRWIDLAGAANARDVGGTALRGGGEVPCGRLIRSDNLQGLTTDDIDLLLDMGLTDVIDLRSRPEVESEGPGPLTGVPGITFHHHSFFIDHPGDALDPRALPWVGLPPSVRVDDFQASTYLSFLADRPDSVVGALRAVAGADGVALVHCAAGKDRTGTTAALALSLVGADRDAIVDEYAASNERMSAIIDRLLESPTYHANLVGRPRDSHHSNPETMDAFLGWIEQRGGAEAVLSGFGWTSDDSVRLRDRLLG